VPSKQSTEPAVGVCIRFPKGDVPNRRSFVEDAFRLAAKEKVTALMPCGHFSTYTPTQIPLADVPCPCGNPQHFLVVWKEAER